MCRRQAAKQCEKSRRGGGGDEDEDELLRDGEIEKNYCT